MLYVVQIRNEEVGPKFKVDDIDFSWDVIYSNEEMEDMITKIESGIFTPEEMYFVTKYRIACFYNNELEENYRNDMRSQMPTIYKKSYIKSEISNKPFAVKGLEYLEALVGSGIISNCGAGYVFDNGKVIITDEERERAIELMFREYR